MSEAKMYYVRDMRQVVGNCALWWRKGDAGYTCNLEEAALYTEEEARKRTQDRDGMHVAYPADQVRAIVVTHVHVDTLAYAEVPKLRVRGMKPRKVRQSCNRHFDCERAKRAHLTCCHLPDCEHAECARSFAIRQGRAAGRRRKALEQATTAGAERGT